MWLYWTDFFDAHAGSNLNIESTVKRPFVNHGMVAGILVKCWDVVGKESASLTEV